MKFGPENEQETSFLFARTIELLGFQVESFGQCFPDLILTNKAGEKIRAELEYKSSRFKEHRHPISECDLVICWFHDWPECPIEVLELSSELPKILEATQRKINEERIKYLTDDRYAMARDLQRNAL